VSARDRAAWAAKTLLAAFALWWFFGMLILVVYRFDGPLNPVVEIATAAIALSSAFLLRLYWPPMRSWSALRDWNASSGRWMLDHQSRAYAFHVIGFGVFFALLNREPLGLVVGALLGAFMCWISLRRERRRAA
jgi:hypothetical protein